MKRMIYDRRNNNLIGEFDISPDANLSYASLSNTDLSSTDLSGANLSDADLKI